MYEKNLNFVRIGKFESNTLLLKFQLPVAATVATAVVVVVAAVVADVAT